MEEMKCQYLIGWGWCVLNDDFCIFIGHDKPRGFLNKQILEKDKEDNNV